MSKTPLTPAQRQALYRLRLRSKKMQDIIKQIQKLERRLERLSKL